MERTTVLPRLVCACLALLALAEVQGQDVSGLPRLTCVDSGDYYRIIPATTSWVVAPGPGRPSQNAWGSDQYAGFFTKNDCSVRFHDTTTPIKASGNLFYNFSELNISGGSSYALRTTVKLDQFGDEDSDGLDGGGLVVWADHSQPVKKKIVLSYFLSRNKSIAFNEFGVVKFYAFEWHLDNDPIKSHTLYDGGARERYYRHSQWCSIPLAHMPMTLEAYVLDYSEIIIRAGRIYDSMVVSSFTEHKPPTYVGLEATTVTMDYPDGLRFGPWDPSVPIERHSSHCFVDIDWVALNFLFVLLAYIVFTLVIIGYAAKLKHKYNPRTFKLKAITFSILAMKFLAGVSFLADVVQAVYMYKLKDANRLYLEYFYATVVFVATRQVYHLFLITLVLRHKSDELLSDALSKHKSFYPVFFVCSAFNLDLLWLYPWNCDGADSVENCPSDDYKPLADLTVLWQVPLIVLQILTITAPDGGKPVLLLGLSIQVLDLLARSGSAIATHIYQQRHRKVKRHWDLAVQSTMQMARSNRTRSLADSRWSGMSTESIIARSAAGSTNKNATVVQDVEIIIEADGRWDSGGWTIMY